MTRRSHANNRSCRADMSLPARAFTLVELIAVIILVGVLAVSAAVSFNSIPASRRTVAERQIQRDLVFARERTMATGIRHWVVFSVPTQSYSVLAENPLNPGRANATTITDPATQSPFVQRLNLNEYTGVTLASATFDSAAEVGFNWLGEPLNTTANALAATGVVQITGGGQVQVQIGTGMVVHVP